MKKILLLLLFASIFQMNATEKTLIVRSPNDFTKLTPMTLLHIAAIEAYRAQLKREAYTTSTYGACLLGQFNGKLVHFPTRHQTKEGIFLVQDLQEDTFALATPWGLLMFDTDEPKELSAQHWAYLKQKALERMAHYTVDNPKMLSRNTKTHKIYELLEVEGIRLPNPEEQHDNQQFIPKKQAEQSYSMLSELLITDWFPWKNGHIKIRGGLASERRKMYEKYCLLDGGVCYL